MLKPYKDVQNILYIFFTQKADIASATNIVIILPIYSGNILFKNQHMIQNINCSKAIFFRISSFNFHMPNDIKIPITKIINRQIPCSKASPLPNEYRIQDPL